VLVVGLRRVVVVAICFKTPLGWLVSKFLISKDIRV
jgi:hypothetical protein